MKVRNGFVSNSSSSSFVVIGFEIDFNESKVNIDDVYKNGFQVLEGEDDGLQNGVTVVGKQISGGEYEISKENYSKQNLDDLASKVRKFFNISEDKEWNLYCGSRYC